MTELSASEWDSFLAGHPGAHLLQTAAWGELKAGFGWRPRRVSEGDCGAQVLFRQLAPGLRLAYLPRGPVGSLDWLLLWPELERLCQREGAFALKVEPDCWMEQPDSHPGMTPNPPGLAGIRPSPQCIQPPRTLLVSLAGSEEDILLRMKQKTRYNIHLAQKKGVAITASNDVPAYHRLALETGRRDGFFVHSLGYYQRAYDLFHRNGSCELLTACSGDELLAGLMVFRSGVHAYYLYGASSDQGRNLMSTYLLQWEAMRWAKSAGCEDYDLWGIPDVSLDKLEQGFASQKGGLWGVYRFKRGFGGVMKRTPGAYDRVYSPLGYSLYKLGLRIKSSRD